MRKIIFLMLIAVMSVFSVAGCVPDSADDKPSHTEETSGTDGGDDGKAEGDTVDEEGENGGTWIEIPMPQK